MRYKEFVQNQNECPFCNLKKEEVVFEDSFGKIILARAPHHKHHLLVIPKKHYSKLHELSTEEQKELFRLIFFAQEIITKFYENFTIIYREGKNTGKSIEHMHINIIPEIPIGVKAGDVSNREISTEKEYYDTLENLKKMIESDKI